jgi:hypothetical protein
MLARQALYHFCLPKKNTVTCLKFIMLNKLVYVRFALKFQECIKFCPLSEEN